MRSNPILGYFRRLKAHGHTLSREAETFFGEVQFVTVDAIRNRPSIVPAEPGIYGWWFDDALERITGRSLAREGFRLLYVGISPSAPAKDGRQALCVLKTRSERTGDEVRQE
jgi:hypothetical protein